MPKPAVKDAIGLYEVERRAYHAARSGFRIAELQISPTQKVPWHSHSNVQDTFYVIEGELRLYMKDPEEDVRLKPSQCRKDVSDLPGPPGNRRIRFHSARLTVVEVAQTLARCSAGPRQSCDQGRTMQDGVL
jgi:hypothetical protein